MSIAVWCFIMELTTLFSLTLRKVWELIFSCGSLIRQMIFTNITTVHPFIRASKGEYLYVSGNCNWRWKWVVKVWLLPSKSGLFWNHHRILWRPFRSWIYPYSSTGPCICGCKTSWHGWTRNSAGSSCGRLINSFHYDKRTCWICICSESNVSQCDRILSKAIFQKWAYGFHAKGLSASSGAGTKAENQEVSLEEQPNIFHPQHLVSSHKSVQMMIDYTEKHYQEDISIQNLAEYCSINPNYASQIFVRKQEEPLSAIWPVCGLNMLHGFLHTVTKPYLPLPLRLATVTIFILQRCSKK